MERARLRAHADPTPAAAPRRTSGRRAAGALAALTAACVAMYAHGLGGAFVIDDRTFFVENDDLPNLELADAATVFMRPTNAWGDFQPIRDLFFVVEHSAFGASTPGYHVVSLALYAIACLLAYALARSLLAADRGPAPAGSLRGSDGAAFAVAALFAAHPSHVEAVAYICGQKELLSAVFSLASLLAFRRGFAERGRRAAWISAGFAFYGLGILSKQTAIMLGALVPLLYLLAEREQRPPWLRSAAIWAAVNVPALLWMISSRAAFQALWASTSALGEPSLVERLPRALKILGAHARLAVWPHPLSFGYPFDASPRADANLVAGAAALVVLGAVAWRYRREKAVLFGAAAFALFLVPVLQLHGSLNNASIYDRYLFLPILGLALVVERLTRGIVLGRSRSPRGYAGALAALALCGAGLTLAHVPAFADDVAVSRNSYERFPAWSRPAFELAYSLVEAGRLREARELLAAEPSLGKPRWVRPYLEGWMMLVEGRADDAIPVLRSASWLAAAGGYYPFPSIPLGRALLETGRAEEAERELRPALASPIHQPLEGYHARKLLERIARARSGASAGGPAP